MAIKDFRFDNLPRSTQILTFTIVMLGLAAGYYFYSLKDTIRERDEIQTDISRLEVTVAQGNAIEGRLKRFRQELVQLEAYLTTLQNILPAEKETPNVLRNFQQMAAASNLKIVKFTPQPLVPRAFYSDWPISMELEGNYDSLGSFFEKVSQATRIVNVDSIAISGYEKDKEPNPARTLSAKCTATTFVFRGDPSAAPATPAQGKAKTNKEVMR
jgi:type IV pilus assembly protein PilO